MLLQRMAKSNKIDITKKLGRIMLRPAVPSLVFTVFLFVVFSLIAPGFMSFANIEAIFIQVAMVGTAAMALNYVILAGEIDISTSSMIAVCAYVFGTFATSMNSVFIPLLLTLIAGGILGAINGFLVSYLKLSSFIATLGNTEHFARSSTRIWRLDRAQPAPRQHVYWGLGRYLASMFQFSSCLVYL